MPGVYEAEIRAILGAPLTGALPDRWSSPRVTNKLAAAMIAGAEIVDNLRQSQVSTQRPNDTRHAWTASSDAMIDYLAYAVPQGRA